MYISWQISLVLASTLAIIVYRIAIKVTIAAVSDTLISSNASIITSITASGISLVVIMLLQIVSIWLGREGGSTLAIIVYRIAVKVTIAAVSDTLISSNASIISNCLWDKPCCDNVAANCKYYDWHYKEGEGNLRAGGIKPCWRD